MSPYPSIDDQFGNLKKKDISHYYQLATKIEAKIQESEVITIYIPIL
jgi:hypothetical protein